MRQRRKMNKWEVDEHEQWSEKVRSQHFCPPLLDKNRNYEGIWSNKRKSFVKLLGMNGSNFRNETLFVSFAAIITTRKGWNGTNFNARNRVVSSVKMSCNTANHSNYDIKVCAISPISSVPFHPFLVIRHEKHHIFKIGTKCSSLRA